MIRVAESVSALNSDLAPTLSMPHPIVEISELTQLVADHLLLDGQQGLISLACTCRALEEQALSTLWSKQSSLETLIKSTLPPNVLTPRPALRRDDTLLSEFQAGFQPTRRPPQVCNSGRRLASL